MLYKENTKHQLFEDWFENLLLTQIPRKSYIVLDNATFHRKKNLHAIARKRKCRLLFLPPYSPDLNDIEKQWANKKRNLRKNAHTHSSFFNALLFKITNHHFKWWYAFDPIRVFDTASARRAGIASLVASRR